jgi:membrane protein
MHRRGVVSNTAPGAHDMRVMGVAHAQLALHTARGSLATEAHAVDAMSTGEAGGRTLARIDRWQQGHRVSAITVATVKKFRADQSTNLAALLAFWAFFSIFPLMLAAATLLGWLLPSNVSNDVLDTIRGYVPLIDFSRKTISGSWWALVLGLASALWGATCVTRTARVAFDSVWRVSEAEQAGVIEQTVGGLKALTLIGVALVLSVLTTGFVSGTSHQLAVGPLAIVGGYAIAVVIDVVVFVIAFRVLTSREVSTRDVLAGALLAGVGFWVLQSLSSVIISRYLHSAQKTYGNFATVITLLWWFYLTGILTLIGAQLNVVLRERSWPRSLRQTD